MLKSLGQLRMKIGNLKLSLKERRYDMSSISSTILNVAIKIIKTKGANNTMTNNNSSFAERFKNKGELAEYLFFYLQGQKAIVFTGDWVSRKFDTDFLVINKPKDGIWDYKSKEQFVRCEVKQDNKCWNTGNLFLEYKTVRKGTGKLETEKEEDGWIVKTRADELWYFDTKNKRFYVFDMWKLKAYYYQEVVFNHSKKVKTRMFPDREDNANKEGLLYNIKEDKAKALKHTYILTSSEILRAKCDIIFNLLSPKDKNAPKADKNIIMAEVKEVGRIVGRTHGKATQYKSCLGIPELDNYAIRHRDLDFVKKYVNTMIKECVDADGMRAFAEAKTLL